MTTTDSEALEAFRRNVRRRIDDGHTTVTELARRSSIARSVLSDVLHGHYGITLANADKVAQALGIPLSTLIVESEK